MTEVKKSLLQLKIPRTASNKATLASAIPNIINQENVIIVLG